MRRGIAAIAMVLVVTLAQASWPPWTLDSASIARALDGQEIDASCTLLGSLGITADSAAALDVKDADGVRVFSVETAGTGYYKSETHAADGSFYAAAWFNDTHADDVPGLEIYIEDDGDTYFGNEAAHDVFIYTNNNLAMPDFWINAADRLAYVTRYSGEGDPLENAHRAYSPVLSRGDTDIYVPYSAAQTDMDLGAWASKAASHRSSAQALTTGTMTENYTGTLASGVSSYSWTNDMVVALGDVLAGDIPVCSLPAKTILQNAYIVIGTAATGLDTVTVSLGKTATAYVDYILASDAMAADGTLYGNTIAQRGALLGGTGATQQSDLASMSGATGLYLHVACTDAGGDRLHDVLTCTGTIYLETTVLP